MYLSHLVFFNPLLLVPYYYEVIIVTGCVINYNLHHNKAKLGIQTTVTQMIFLATPFTGGYQGVDSDRCQEGTPHSLIWRALLLSPPLPPAFSTRSALPLPPGTPLRGDQLLGSHRTTR